LPQILALYDLLKSMSDNAMVMLNHSIAAAIVHDTPKRLELLAALDSDPRFAGPDRLEAVRAHLLEMAGSLVRRIGEEQEAVKTAFNLHLNSPQY
jgi:predicted RNA polymerase sigma factor